MSRNRGSRYPVNNMDGYHNRRPGAYVRMQGAPQHSMEEELSMRHEEIQRMVAENQLIYDDINALRRDIPLVKQEVLALDQTLIRFRADKEMEIRDLIQRGLKLEAEMRLLEPKRAELMQLRADTQKLEASIEELTSQVQSLSKELKLIQAESQNATMMRGEIDGLHAELVRARSAYEFEKRASVEQLDQRQAMEKNLVSLSRELESLSAEVEKRRKGPLGAPGGPSGYHPRSFAY